jgi:hypothetical protein
MSLFAWCKSALTANLNPKGAMFKSTRKFFAKLRFKLFVWRIDSEIYNRLFAHLEGERDCGYPFATDEQMDAQTKARDIRAFLDLIDQQTKEMPKAYGEAFRYLMQRDLYNRVQEYAKLVQRRIPPRSRIQALMS